MTCFTWFLLIVGGVLLVLSLIRWFEQVTEAVRNGWWNKTFLLVLFPFAVWFYPSRVAAGRPTPVPLHEPVRGFGSMPKARPAPEPAVPEKPRASAAPAADGPPPGTPAEFLLKPQVPPKKPLPKPAIDPDKIAKLKQKMREQGMIGDEE
jgi:hypothetical protein